MLAGETDETTKTKERRKTRVMSAESPLRMASERLLSCETGDTVLDDMMLKHLMLVGGPWSDDCDSVTRIGPSRAIALWHSAEH